MDAKTNSTAPRTWGISAAEFYADLRWLVAQVGTMDGKAYKGKLVGVDQYDVILKQSSGAVLLLAKHAVKLVVADVVEAKVGNA